MFIYRCVVLVHCAVHKSGQIETAGCKKIMLKLSFYFLDKNICCLGNFLSYLLISVTVVVIVKRASHNNC